MMQSIQAKTRTERLKHTPKQSGGLTSGGTHDRPLRGDSEIVRGCKSKPSLVGNSHQVVEIYRYARAKVKGEK